MMAITDLRISVSK